ncbi:hypothetical protein Bca4012_006219 [Brassica carinata]
MLLIGSRVSIQSHQSGLICHPRRFSNAAWIWKFVVDCSSFSFGMYLFLGFCSYQTMSFVLSGILTHLPAFGVLFDNEEVKGPMIQYLIRPEEYIKRFHPIGLEKLQFVEDSLKILRQELTAFKYSIYGGGQLTPEMWEPWSKPYIKELSETPRSTLCCRKHGMIVAVREADLDDGMRETIIALDEIKLVSSAELKLVTSVAIFSSERMRRRARAEKASL